MVTIDIDITQTPDVDVETRQYTEEQIQLIAALIQSVLRSPKSLWPVKTGQSKRAMRARVSDGHIRITNRHEYVPIVNNRRRYPSGKRNPNYRALQRTIERQWSNITSKLGS